MRRLVLAAIALLSVAGTATAQKLEWSLDFNTVFDNREGDRKITDTKTFFHTQLAPEIGLSMLDKNNGKHSVMGGVVWTQPIGAEWYGKRLSPTLYYRYSHASNGWSMAMGMFPKALMHRRLPNYVWNDSINYKQHNLRGFMATYSGENGYFEAIVDWRAMQSTRRREAFNIIAHGEWQRPEAMFLAGGVAVMNHLARSKEATPDQHVVDNFIVNPYVGLDFGRHTSLDSLTVRAGMLGSITRNRGDGAWKTPMGAWIDIALQWKWLGFKNTSYIGSKPLFPYYGEFGPLLDQGEPYYRTPWYDRAEVYGYLLKNKFMEMKASLDFNIAKENFTFYQRLIVKVYFDGSFR